jgi:hypothetical protein
MMKMKMKMSSFFYQVLQVMEHQWNEIDRGKVSTCYCTLFELMEPVASSRGTVEKPNLYKAEYVCYLPVPEVSVVNINSYRTSYFRFSGNIFNEFPVQYTTITPTFAFQAAGIVTVRKACHDSGG